MNDDDKDYNGFTHTFTWSADPEHMHPYTYNWFNLLNETMQEVDECQKDLEWELAYHDLLDALIDQMTSFPEVEELLKNF